MSYLAVTTRASSAVVPELPEITLRRGIDANHCSTVNERLDHDYGSPAAIRRGVLSEKLLQASIVQGEPNFDRDLPSCNRVLFDLAARVDDLKPM